SPHVAITQLARQAPSSRLSAKPSSHSSPGSTVPSPQAGSDIAVLAVLAMSPSAWPEPVVLLLVLLVLAPPVLLVSAVLVLAPVLLVLNGSLAYGFSVQPRQATSGIP